MIPVFANHGARLAIEIELKMQERESGNDQHLSQVQRDIPLDYLAVPFHVESSHTTADIICETGLIQTELKGFHKCVN